jgi:tetratricopeptide (TPR) repeat protein
MGLHALILNQNREALRWRRDAVRYQPKIASDCFNFGIAYERLNNNSASVSAYKRAYELDPWNSSYAEAAGKKAEAKQIRFQGPGLAVRQNAPSLARDLWANVERCGFRRRRWVGLQGRPGWRYCNRRLHALVIDRSQRH